MASDEHSLWGETEIRELFARPGVLATHSEALGERIIAGATARRRRSSLLTIAGTVSATLALVAAAFSGRSRPTGRRSSPPPRH